MNGIANIKLIMLDELYLKDEMYTPIHYRGKVYERPHYKGSGEHSVQELENIVEALQGYASQQQVIKESCMKYIVELKHKLQWELNKS